jgi:hypothetical protein
VNRWYYTPDNRERLGPVTPEQLRQLALSGVVRPDHMVLREGSRGGHPSDQSAVIARKAKEWAASPTSRPVFGGPCCRSRNRP